MAPGSRRRGFRLITLSLHVASICDGDRLHNQLLGLDGPGDGRGEMKKLIFAADGPKPKIARGGRDRQRPGDRGERRAPPGLRPGPGPYWPTGETE